jgi:hypothetical protein
MSVKGYVKTNQHQNVTMPVQKKMKHRELLPLHCYCYASESPAMFPCVRFRSLAYIITFILFLSVYIHLLSGGNQSPIPTENGQQGRPIHESTLSKEQFIEAAIKSATVDDYDDTAIRAMCDAQDWNMSVVFTCRGTIGGVGEKLIPRIYPRS